ncbi:MAG: hypothetical protein ABMA25_14845, partial [Ilumatobacteraceae bacterium]
MVTLAGVVAGVVELAVVATVVSAATVVEAPRLELVVDTSVAGTPFGAELGTSVGPRSASVLATVAARAGSRSVR